MLRSSRASDSASSCGENAIRSIAQRLVDAKVDIVEVGFLWDDPCGTDIARFHTIEDVKRILPKEKGSSKYSLMADFIDLKNLEPNDGTIDIVRLSFKRHRLDWARKTAAVLRDKGYEFFINPVNCNVYTDEEYIEVLKVANDLHPYGFSIVDTFGVLRKRDLTRLYNLVENHLDKDITIGLHLHENLGLAYTLAQHFIETRRPTRDIVIDASLLGMGREPGNLCTEQIMDHLKAEFDAPYCIEPALDAIDDYIAPIKAEHPWGYSIPYALSAKYHLHRTYGEYLMNKKRLKTKDIQRILSRIEASEAELFNEAYVEQLYKEYMDVWVDDTNTVAAFKSVTEKYDAVLLVAPGMSIVENAGALACIVKEEAPMVMGVNFSPEFATADYVFCSNPKRYDMLFGVPKEALLVTSNIADEACVADKVVSFGDLAYHNERYCDDSTLMAINLLSKVGYSGKVMLAGFDGFVDNETNFCDRAFERTHVSQNSNEFIGGILKECYSHMDIEFVTPSLHSRYVDKSE